MTEHEEAKVNLICFPHAGAGPGVYALWGRFLSNDLSFYPVHYPMREKRKLESLPDTIQELARTFVQDNEQLWVEKPFAIYGHCMGSIIAYEVAKAVKELYNVRPILVIVSSSLAPNCTIEQQIDETMNVKQIAKFFAELNYMDDSLIEDEMYANYFLPVLKADYLLQQKYVDVYFKKLDCPLLVLYGENDIQIDKNKLSDWKQFSSSEVLFESIEGGHFFVNKENIIKFLPMLQEKILKKLI